MPLNYWYDSYAFIQSDFFFGLLFSISFSLREIAVAKPGSMPKSSKYCANSGQAPYILSNPHTNGREKYQSLPIKNVLKLPGTHWMRFATMALKWALISLRISASLSFSTSKCTRVRSIYSRNRAPMARLSRSRAPFVLHDDAENRWINAFYQHMSACKSKSRIVFYDPMILSVYNIMSYLSLTTPASARSSKMRSSWSLSRSLRSRRFLFC